MADHSQIILKNYKKLIAYGCSNTAGDELSDHYVLGLDFEACNAHKKKFNTQTEWENSNWNGRMLSEYLEKHNTTEKNKILAWPCTLAKKLGIGYTNRAHGGNSISHMYWQFVNDFYNHKIESTDLVVIGLTLIPRYTLMKKTSKGFEIKARTILDDVERGRKGLETVLDIFSDEKLVWEYYNWLLLFQFFAQQNHIKILMVPCTSSDVDPNHDEWFFENIASDVKRFAKQVWKDLKKTVLITDQGLENFFEDPDFENFSGFNHFPEHNHRAYGEHIYSKLKIV